MAFQLTRPVRGEPPRRTLLVFAQHISTHSPRAGRTRTLAILRTLSIHFNSLAPCGANRAQSAISLFLLAFQLTRPVRGEPRRSPTCSTSRSNFNSLAPCGANRRYCYADKSQYRFQLTRPVRGEPGARDYTIDRFAISTHSPRAGRTALCHYT